ncbi:MAG: lamin tail domain-containing protein, partial [Nanoarchaeota archaeon]|nr:lamin tail domain-containing protein [Nanoarchaeota archaeon]
MKKICLGGIIVTLLILSIATVQGDVLISEVMYDVGSSQGGDFNEWIELYNNGTSEVDLTGWKINDIAFSAITIGVDEYIVVAEDLTGRFDEYFSNNDTVWDSNDAFNATDSSALSFDDSSDKVNITNSTGDLIDVMSYDSSLGADGDGKTLERRNFISN